MTIAGHNPSSKAVLRWGAAFALSCLLAFGLVPLGVQRPAEAAPEGEGTPVVVEAANSGSRIEGGATAEQPLPEAGEPKSGQDEPAVVPPASEPAPDPEPAPAPPADPEPVPAPEPPAADNVWPLGADEPSAVVAELWDDGTFVVDGAGAAVEFAAAEDVPWLSEHAADIKRVVFADDVEPTSLAHWFEGCGKLQEVANIPAKASDLTRAFFDCPLLKELPDNFALMPDAKADECFGFSEPRVQPLETIYRGSDEGVLAYAWARDGRTLVNPDAPVAPEAPEDTNPPDADPGQQGDQPEAEGPAPDGEAVPADDPEAVPEDESPLDPAELPADADAAEPAADEPQPEAPASGESAPEPQPASQVSITVPSSAPLMLGQDGQNSAAIPVSVANRSDADVRIVGVRLKRSDVDLPGGSWSLVSPRTGTHFVDEARFTPLGLEAVLSTPVILPADSENMNLVWEGSFTDFGMKTLLKALVEADGTFTYGTMIWHIEAA